MRLFWPNQFTVRRLRAAAAQALRAQDRNFLALWTATTVSQFGTMLGALILTAVVYLRASPSQLGLLAAAMSAPVLLFALLAGVWIDRLPHQRVMVVADFGRFVLLLTVPCVAFWGRLHIEQLYLVGFVVGSLDVLFSLAYRSVLPTLVPHDQLLDANSKLQMSDSITQTVSPALGGGIVQVAGGPIAVLVDAITFFASGLLLRQRDWPRSSKTMRPRSAVAESLEGFSTVVRQPALRAVFGMASTYSFFSGFLLALYSFWVVRELGFSPLTLGLLMGAGGLGSLAGAGLAGPVTRRLGWGPSVVGTYLLAAAALIAIPLARGPSWLGFTLLLGDQFFGDILWIIHNVSAMSVRQAVTPRQQLGRVNGTFLLASQGLRPLGALVAGPTAHVIGIQGTLVVMVVGINAAGLWLLCSPLMQMKTVPASTEDNIGEPPPP